jgi:hypothetical protein
MRIEAQWCADIRDEQYVGPFIQGDSFLQPKLSESRVHVPLHVDAPGATDFRS